MKNKTGLTVIITLVLMFMVCAAYDLFAQNGENQNGVLFYFDAICFRDNADSGRIDVYVLVPYQSLEFVKAKDNYGSQYEATVKAIDTSGKVIDQKYFKRDVIEMNYFDSQGGTGKFDYSQTILHLPAGKYEIEATVTDNYTKKSSVRSRNITVLNFSKFPNSLSGILLVSSIEENGSKFILTPHISDNIGDLGEGFFAFFEVYALNFPQMVDFVYEFVESSDKKEVVYKSQRIRQNIDSSITQHFFKVNFPKGKPQGTYILRIIELKPSTTDEFTEADYLAVTERSVKSFKSFGGMVIGDIDKSIKELRYVAKADEIEYVEAGTTTEEKQKRFEEFWAKKDPTPNTDRNEAFEQYYARIEIANKRYKSYSEGWMTDKGMVYIIYGEPNNTDKSAPYSDGRVFERWSYPNGMEIIFVDNSGFGDFRLYSPMSIMEKYVYKK
jgi:GWxTD domain-containing protein